MKKIFARKTEVKFKRLSASIIAIMFSGVVSAQTTDVELAKNPLEAGVEPPPNVLMIVDDSASMDWEVAVQGSEGRFSVGQFLYGQLFGNTAHQFGNVHEIDDDSGLVVPTQEMADAFINGYPGTYAYEANFAEIWRLRNSDFNRMYYNPAETYEPWDGKTLADMDPTQAVLDPSNPSSATVNLTNARLDFFFPQPGDFPGDGFEDTGAPKNRPTIPSPVGDVQVPDQSYTGNIMFYYDATGNKINIDPASAEARNFTAWFTYYRRRELAAKGGLTKVIQNAPDIRLGYTTINSGVPGDGLGRRPTGAYDVKVEIGADGTRKQDVLDAVNRTYAGLGGTHLRKSLDEAGKYFECAAGGTFGDNKCPRVSVAEGGACQRNISVLMTDGYWEYDAPPLPQSYQNYDGGTPTDFNGGAFADNVSGTLADIAMYYFQRDLAPGLDDKVSVTSKEQERTRGNLETLHQHMNTFTLAFGVQSAPGVANFLRQFENNGRWIPPTDLDTNLQWPAPDFADTHVARRDQDKIEDLKHAAFNGRGDYYNALDGQSLVDNLSRVFRSATEGSGVIAAPSFSTQEMTAGNILYSASYDVLTNSGDVKAYTFDPESGVIESELWSAADQLDVSNDTANCTSSDSRLILTSDSNNGVLLTAANASSDLSADQVSWLRGHNDVELVCGGTLRERDNSEASLIGDIINSRPLFVGGPDFFGREFGAYPTGDTYFDYVQDEKDRAPVVTVGSNDGMLHFFDASTGQEVMAYMPQDLVQPASGNNDVADLTSPDYSHDYFVDLSPAVNDVYIKPKNNGDRSWRTVVIGGYRSGGKGYFALDITDEIDSASDATGAVMWELHADDLPAAAGNKMGMSFSAPLMTMSNEENTPEEDGNKWVAVFANGYNSVDGDASLFVVDIEEGYNGWTDTEYEVITAPGSAATGNAKKNGLSEPRGIDVDGNGTVDYVYAGDLKGNLWRFDLTTSPGSAVKIFNAERNGVVQPITTQPTVVRSPADPMKYIVVVTTGSWMTVEDALDTNIQSIYGIVDDPSVTSGINPPTRASGLVARNIANVAYAADPTLTVRQITGNNFDPESDGGWYMDFLTSSPDGERATRNMITRGGYAFVNTVYPSVDSCSANQGGSIMAFNPVTGLLDKPMFDLNNNEEFEVTEQFAGMVSDDSTYANSALYNNILFSHANTAGGSSTPIGTPTNTEPPVRAGRLSWRQIK